MPKETIYWLVSYHSNAWSDRYNESSANLLKLVVIFRTNGSRTSKELPVEVDSEGMLVDNAAQAFSARHFNASAIFHCRERDKHIVKKSFPQFPLVVKREIDIPRTILEAAKESEATMNEFVKTIPCGMCPSGTCQIDIPGSMPCLTRGLRASPGVSNEFLHSLFVAAQEFWQAKPWLYLRMNHVLAMDCDQSEFKYVQVIGGGGQCSPMLQIHKSWDSVQNEVSFSDFVFLFDCVILFSLILRSMVSLKIQLQNTGIIAEFLWNSVNLTTNSGCLCETLS